jgi:hypothetical protein
MYCQQSGFGEYDTYHYSEHYSEHSSGQYSEILNYAAIYLSSNAEYYLE